MRRTLTAPSKPQHLSSTMQAITSSLRAAAPAAAAPKRAERTVAQATKKAVAKKSSDSKWCAATAPTPRSGGARAGCPRWRWKTVEGGWGLRGGWGARLAPAPPVTCFPRRAAGRYGADRPLYLPKGLLDPSDVPSYLDGSLPGECAPAEPALPPERRASPPATQQAPAAVRARQLRTAAGGYR